MKAIIIHTAKDLRVENIYQETDVKAGEVRLAVSYGGICGSDLHYFHHGGVGQIKLRQPMILGHEVSGRVMQTGTGVTGLVSGDKVVLNPSRSCGTCSYCCCDMRNQCLDMRFNGSAMRFPHEQGLFRSEIIVPEKQLVKLSPNTDLAMAAMAEPLAVCLNAVRKAGSLVGKTILVSGCGPIGCLTILAAKHAGASKIIATDIAAMPLDIASKLGATTVINVSENSTALNEYRSAKGTIDVVFECSAAAPALQVACEIVRPRGAVITVGMSNAIPLPQSLIVTKEIALIGSFRFDEEFAIAADLIDRGCVDVGPLITSVLPMEDAVEAFLMAADKSRAMKVQLKFQHS